MPRSSLELHAWLHLHYLPLSRYPYHFYTDASMVLDAPFSNSSPVSPIRLLPIFKPILLPRTSSPASATGNFKSCFGSPLQRLWFCTPNQAPTIIQDMEVFAGGCIDCPRMLACLVLVYISLPSREYRVCMHWVCHHRSDLCQWCWCTNPSSTFPVFPLFSPLFFPPPFSFLLPPTPPTPQRTHTPLHLLPASFRLSTPPSSHTQLQFSSNKCWFADVCSSYR